MALSDSFWENLDSCVKNQKLRIEMSWIRASLSNYECNLRQVKAACNRLSTMCSHLCVTLIKRSRQNHWERFIYKLTQKATRHRFLLWSITTKGYPPFIARRLHMLNTCECMCSDSDFVACKRVHSNEDSFLTCASVRIINRVWFNSCFLKEYLIFRYVNRSLT